ncbi:MAG: rRNA maturation RNase YbeY, partial [Acetoanaerobium sp.]|nr:rRNA maturation RNase YbeY [Acetoanaerobium sp.]
MLQLLFENDSNYIPANDLLKMLESVMLKSLELEGFTKEVEISLTFTTDELIKEINSKHRNMDKATDVLSFPMYEKQELSDINTSISNFPVALGDIVVSVERAFSQAEEYGHSFEREMAFLVCHSMFHLLG